MVYSKGPSIDNSIAQKSAQQSPVYDYGESVRKFSSLQSYIVDPDKKLSASFDRSGYIHNLKIRIHNNSYQQMLESENIANDKVLLRAMDNIANSLELVAELCQDCTHHVADISHTRHSLS